jgi:hypothetical protein
VTTAATSNFELTRDQILRRAYQVAGLLEASQLTDANDVAMAADFLQMELVSLVSDSTAPMWVTRTTVALVASTAAYTLTDCLDVVIDANNAAGMHVPSSGSETVVQAMTRAEYQAISNKDSTGTPSMVYIERLATVTATFWPVPAATATFRYSSLRWPRDMDTGARTLDLSKRWQKAITYSMAHQLALAKSAPLDRVQYLEGLAERYKMRAREADVEHVHGQLFVGRSY